MITVPPTNVAVQLGMPAQFMCVAIGTPSPSISWLKNGVPLQQDTNTIQLASTQLSDQAVYSCVASNNAGTTQASANLTIIGMMIHACVCVCVCVCVCIGHFAVPAGFVSMLFVCVCVCVYVARYT